MRLPRAVCTRSTRTQQQGRASFLFEEGQGEAAVAGELRTAGGGRPNHPVAAACVGARPGCPFGADGRLNRVLSFAPRPPIVRNGIAGAREPFLVATELFQRFRGKELCAVA